MTEDIPFLFPYVKDLGPFKEVPVILKSDFGVDII